MAISKENSQLSVVVPKETRLLVEDYAKSLKTSVSHASRLLIEMGLYRLQQIEKETNDRQYTIFAK